MLSNVSQRVLSKGPGGAADTEMALVGLMNMVFACAPPATWRTRCAARCLQAEPVMTCVTSSNKHDTRSAAAGTAGSLHSWR